VSRLTPCTSDAAALAGCGNSTVPDDAFAERAGGYKATEKATRIESTPTPICS